jgi:mRNA-degrading endonuclease toxin of MazEF toxin-antitoxin module
VICDFGDVVVVPFPFVNIAAEKRRPSLILSRQTFNEDHGHSICAMITTAARSDWPSDVEIRDLASAGLPRSCVIRWKLFTLPNAIILRRAGMLGETDRTRAAAAVREILA